MGRFPAIGLRGRLAISIALILAVALGVTYVAVYRGTGADLRQQTESDLTREVESLSRSMAAPPDLDTEEYSARAGRLVQAQPFGPTSRLIAISIRGGATATNQPELLGVAPPLERTPAGSSASLRAPLNAGGSGSDKPDDHEDRPEHGGSDDGGSDDSGSDDSGSDDSHDGSSSDDDRDSARRLLTSGRGFTTVRIEGVGDVRLLTSVVALPDGNAAAIRVGEPLEPVERALEGLSRTFLLVGLITLLVAAGAGWLLASRTTRPMRRMPISETNNDEVRRLAESFNHMLDRLEAAFTGQRAFVADASHDLRTPLTIVQGQLEVLARNPNPDAAEVRRVTAQVTAATGRMERLVDDLLLLARADSGAGFSPEASELEPLLAAEVEALGETSGRLIELGEVSPRPVLLERERVSRAVTNLITNAVSHTGEGGRIRVSAVGRGEWVVIAVDDDGPGVPVEMRERVFDRFARLDSSRSSDSGGSGLGLAIVSAVAELHGGQAACSDSPLGGARFTITLPAA
jgi:signal transduction histidine kinase